MTAFVKDRPEVVTDDYLINIVPCMLVTPFSEWHLKLYDISYS